MLQKAGKKFMSLFLAMLLVVSLFGSTGVWAAGDGSDAESAGGYVTVAVEKFTLGQGYLVEPVLVPFQEGDNVAAVITELLGEGQYGSGGTVGSGFYLSSVYDPNAGEVRIPSFILQALGGKEISGRKNADWLSEKDYTSDSGWMYALNNVFPNVGSSDNFIANGDVIRWQYTVYGLGEDVGDHDSLIDLANKDALTEKVAEINSSANKAEILTDADVNIAYGNANAVLTDMESSQSAVNSALKGLKDALGESTELNTAVLATSVQTAELAKSSVKVSLDGTDVGTTDYWVSQAEFDSLAEAIVSAQQLIADDNATQDEVDAKVLALNQSVTAFNAAKKQGLLALLNVTLTVAPKTAQLMLYDSKDHLVDIGQGTVGTYNVYSASLPAGDYSYQGVDASGNSIGGGKLTVSTETNQAFSFRQLNLKASNSGWNAGADYSATIGQDSPSDTSLSFGTLTATGQYPVLVLAGKTYFYSFLPSEAREAENYMALVNSVTVTLNTTAQSQSSAIPTARIITFTVPEEAELFVGRKLKHFIAFEQVMPLDSTTQDGKRVYRYKLGNGLEYNYRVSQEGKLTNVGTFIANDANTNMAITTQQLNVLAPNSILNRGTKLEGNIYFNINEQNQLKLAAPGDEYKLLSLRSWQALIEGINNYFFEPDYHYEIIAGQDIIDIAEGEPGSYSTIRAKANGTAIVKVTYDALKVNGSSYITSANDAFSAIWPENVGLFVVTVGQGETNIVTGIESNKERNQAANAKNSTPVNLQNGAFDADIDSVYFLNSEPGATYTFTPSAGSNVSILRPVIDHSNETVSYGNGIFSTENVTAYSDGSFSILLTEGRNIVKVEKAGKAEYQVMTARPLTVTIDNLTDVDKIIGPGDKVKVTFKGLSFPANKLSGIYNFYAQLNFAAGPNQTLITGTASQYDIVTQGNTVEFTVPAGLEGGYSLFDGRLQLSYYGSPIGDHHNIDALIGANPNMAAVQQLGSSYSIFPRIVIVKEADKAALKLAVSNAKEQLAAVAVSADGKDVLTSGYWVTQEKHDQLSVLIQSAEQLIVDESAIQDKVDAKVLALDQGREAFVNAKQPGLKAVKADLEIAVHAAKGIRNAVASSEDGKDVLESGYWVSTSLYGQFSSLIESAQALIANENASQAEVDAKERTLNEEREAFGGKKQQGFMKADLEAEFVSAELNKHLAYLVNKVSKPTFGSTGGEWTILTLARAGYEVPEKYYSAYYGNVFSEVRKLMPAGKLDLNKSTEHSRLILGLTAIGQDIHDVAHYDIAAALADFDYVTTQGINGTIFALIALDSRGYDIPLSNEGAEQTTREKLVAEILSREVNGGGWALGQSPKTADPDITGMAIQALTPYYVKADKNNIVTKAVDRAIDWLSSVQNENGGFISSGAENVQSVAQVIVALTSLGIDPQTDPRFIKNRHSAVENLLTYALPDGGFVHGGIANAIASDQGIYALVAYSRYLNGLPRLYDMKDVPIQAMDTDGGPVALPDGEQPLVIPDDGKEYTIQVQAADNEKQVPIQLPDNAYWRTYLKLSVGTALPKLVVSRDGNTVEFPQGISMLGESNRTLELMTPNNKNDSSLRTSLIGLVNPNQQLDAVHEYFTLGGDQSVSFDDYVTITFAGAKGKEAAFIQNGQISAIQKFASADEGANSGKNEYAYEVGNDLLVKTNHFTDFVVYSVKDKTSSGGGGGSSPTVQLSIDKLTIDKGYVIPLTTVEFTPGESVWDVLKRELDKRGIAYEYRFTEEFNSVYVESIAGDGEFDHGEDSGWMYSVNGVFPQIGASVYTLQQGDIVRWRYTTKQGDDIGGGMPEEEEGSDDPGAEGSGSEPGTAQPGTPSKTLKDYYADSTSVSSWAHDLVLEATQKGFVQGYNGKLNPKGNITRAEFAKLLVEALNVQATAATANPFRDVKATNWFYPYVNAAYAAGIVTGYNDQFLPNDTITREEMAVMIARALKRETTPSNAGYQDRDQIASWAQASVADLSALSIMSGSAERFDPKGVATREMAIVVTMRAYQYSQKQEG